MRKISTLLVIAASTGGLASSALVKPSITERMGTIDRQLAEWQPMVDMMQLRQGSDGRYQLLVKPATTGGDAVPAPSLQDSLQHLDAQAATLCALSRIVGRVQVRQGSDGRKQLVAASRASQRDEERYCPDAQSPKRQSVEGRLAQHELLVADMSEVMGGVVFCKSSDGRLAALVAHPDRKQQHCKQRAAPL